MRKFALTSQKIQGQIELMFQQNELIYIDFSKAGLTAEQKAYFLQHLIIHQQQLQAFCNKLRLDCIELEIEITFDMFWNKYGYKVDRKRAEAIWNKLPKAKQVAAYYGIDRYEAYLRRTEWRTKMEPKTYLRNERWNDEW
jgi:uncharacterized HAD superfamily protein